MSIESLQWKIKRNLALKLILFFQYFKIIFYKIYSTCRMSGNPTLVQPTLVMGLGSVAIEDSVHIGVLASPYFLNSYAYIEARNPNARISISGGTWINNGFVAIAEHTSISIGKDVLIGSNVKIYDSDFHGIRVEDRKKSSSEFASPVIVGDYVFIGSDVTILKGVTIGIGSIIASGALVTTDVPDNVIVGGVPAKILRRIS